MQDTEEVKSKNLYQKLLHIQREVKGLGKNKDGFGYKYVTGDKVLEHLKPLMNDLGLLLKPEVLSIDNCRQDYATKSGSKSEILSKVMMRFTWIDADTGEKDENLFGANGQNDWDKGVGSALTYAERYFLLKFFHIATDEDDIDNPDRKLKEEEKKQQTPQSAPANNQSNPPQDNDPRPWMTEKALNDCKTRIKKGEADVYLKADKAFKMKKQYRDELKNFKP